MVYQVATAPAHRRRRADRERQLIGTWASLSPSHVFLEAGTAIVGVTPVGQSWFVVRGTLRGPRLYTLGPRIVVRAAHEIASLEAVQTKATQRVIRVMMSDAVEGWALPGVQLARHER